VGAAVVGALSLFISILGGTAIGRAYHGTILPLVVGFGGLALLALAVMGWTELGGRSRAAAGMISEKG
jgi:MFS transporter, DHA1 family, multidrug resistance protein